MELLMFWNYGVYLFICKVCNSTSNISLYWTYNFAYPVAAYFGTFNEEPPVLECSFPRFWASIKETSQCICMSYTPVINLWQKKSCISYKVELIFSLSRVLHNFFIYFWLWSCTVMNTLKYHRRRTLASYSLSHKSPNAHFSLETPLAPKFLSFKLFEFCEYPAAQPSCLS